MSFRLTIFRGCLIIVTLACAGVDAHAQRRNVEPANPTNSRSLGTGSILGRVLLPSGQPANRSVRVSLIALDNTSTMTYTDNNGEFFFANLPEASYQVEILGDAKVYEPMVERVSIFRGAKVSQTYYLREKVADSRKPNDNVVSLAELKQKVPGPAKKEFNRAIRLLNQGNVPEAIEHFKQAITIFPGYLMARNDLGVQYLGLKQYAEAAEQLRAAIEINPKVFNPRLNLGIVLLEQKKFPEALEQFKAATAIDSAQPASHFYAGVIAFKLGALDDSERELAKALALGGGQYVVSRYYIAHVYIKRGKRDAAIQELNAYLEAAPEGEQAAHARQLLEQLR